MKPILNRCVPSAATSLGGQLITSVYSYLNSFDTLQQVASDLYSTRWEMLIMFAVSVVVSFLVVSVCHYMAAIFSHFVLAAVSLAAVTLTALSWWVYIDLHYALDYLPNIVILEEDVANQRFFLALSIALTLTTVVVIAVCVVLSRRVSFLVTLFYEAGNCIQSMPMIMIQPVWTFLCLVAFYAFWLFLVIAMATADYGEKKTVYASRRAVDSSFDNSYFRSPSSSSSSSTTIASLTLMDFTHPSWVKYIWYSEQPSE